MVVECTFRCNNGLWTDSGNDGGKGCAAIPSVGIAEPGGRSGSHCPLHTYVDIPYVYIYVCIRGFAVGWSIPFLRKPLVVASSRDEASSGTFLQKALLLEQGVSALVTCTLIVSFVYPLSVLYVPF